VLYKNVEWALNVDPEVINSAVKDNETKVLIEILMNKCFTTLPA